VPREKKEGIHPKVSRIWGVEENRGRDDLFGCYLRKTRGRTQQTGQALGNGTRPEDLLTEGEGRRGELESPKEGHKWGAQEQKEWQFGRPGEGTNVLQKETQYKRDIRGERPLKGKG